MKIAKVVCGMATGLDCVWCASSLSKAIRITFTSYACRTAAGLCRELKFQVRREQKKMPYRALLVYDERLARRQLRALLAGFPDVEVVAEAGAVPEALAAVQRHRPDVVFLDIQMPGQS